MNNPWLSLEEIPYLTAVLPVWRDYTGDDFPAFRFLCLDAVREIAQTFPCPLEPICFFRVCQQPPGIITGICEADPPICADV